MTDLLVTGMLMLMLMLMGGALAFALARIAIRLQQEPGLAALAGVMIFWQMIILWDGRAALASSVLLLDIACVLLILVRWLHHERVLGRGGAIGLLLLAGLAWGGALLFASVTRGQALLFSVSFMAMTAGAAIAWRGARIRVSFGGSGLAALGLIGIWLIVHSAASYIAVAE